MKRVVHTDKACPRNARLVYCIKINQRAWNQWLIPVILATGEAEIGRFGVLGQHIFPETPISKITNAK
jgi:hypothetical protein